ncbi:MAG: hypothetical protein J6S84_04410 [Bacteroidales bacterium]|nr:hypothetical protein [Bacteroidales bacterium]MBO7651942.1 hypothetical protein [Bacteroidales bacterium]
MTFDKVIEDGRLWAVRYDNDKENALQRVMSQWSDAEWLADFFTQNIDDLISYFKITNIEDAIFQTMEDRDELACIIMDISPDANLDQFFRPLDNNRIREMLLGKEKGRPHRKSWLRLYAIKLTAGIYIITGGAIKLTHTMQEREHTLQELERMEKVRNFLIREGVFDENSFVDYQKEVEL